MPPHQALQLVVFVFLLEAGVVGKCVVSYPQPVGQGVGYDDVHRVVAPGQEKEDDPGDTGEERQPVDRVESLRSIYG